MELARHNANTIKSMVHILAMERRLLVPSMVSGTNLHLSIALKQIWLEIEVHKLSLIVNLSNLEIIGKKWDKK